MVLGIVSGDQESALRRMLAPVKAIEVPGEVRASSWLVRRYGFADGETAAGQRWKVGADSRRFRLHRRTRSST